MIKSTTTQYDSSTVRSASYDYENQTLVIHFNHGSYVYPNVTKEDFEAFHNAESQGKSLNEVIKPKYTFTKINEVIEPAGGKL